MSESSLQQFSESESVPAESSGGDALTVEQAIANLSHPDLSLRYYAAWWLGKFSQGEPKVVDALILALEDEADRTELGGYPLRRNAARALGRLGDRRAVPALLQCLSCSDFYVREAAAESLGSLGDPNCIPALKQLLTGGVAAIQLVPGKPHLSQPAEAAIGALEALRAKEAISLIQPFLQHPIPRVQHVATRALYVLTQDSVYGDRLVQVLDACDLKMRRIVLMDLGASGYLPGAEVIVQAAVENSFKLIALKSLLESHLQQPNNHSLSPSAQRVMTLMDSLL